MTSIAPVALILLMLAGLLWLARRLAGRAGASGRHIQVIETVTLGPGRCLHLVRLAERGLLIASTGQRCELLCELEALPADPQPTETSWIDALRSRLGKT